MGLPMMMVLSAHNCSVLNPGEAMSWSSETPLPRLGRRPLEQILGVRSSVLFLRQQGIVGVWRASTMARPCLCDLS